MFLRIIDRDNKSIRDIKVVPGQLIPVDNPDDCFFVESEYPDFKSWLNNIKKEAFKC